MQARTTRVCLRVAPLGRRTVSSLCYCFWSTVYARVMPSVAKITHTLQSEKLEHFNLYSLILKASAGFEKKSPLENYVLVLIAITVQWEMVNT